jgi:Transcriptional regulator, AbiEi antitoxin/Protein of unknown function (DUF559)
MPDSDAFSHRGGGKKHPSGFTLDSLIARLAATQFGVVSLSQLLAIGLSYRQIEGRVRRGWLHPLYRGVYAVGHARVVPQGRLLAALLAVRPDPFLTHRTSSAAWGLREINTRQIELTVVSTGGRPRPGLTVHRIKQPPDPEEIVVRSGLRVSSVPRMLIELAPREHPRELDRLITQAVRKRIFDVDAMEAALQRHARSPGVAKLRTALTAYRPKPERRSGFEIAFDEFLAEHPEIPDPARTVHLGIWEIDCYWPQHQLAIELDGRAWHVAVRDAEKDRIKDTKLQRDGIRVMRITELRFDQDRRGILEDVYGFLKIRPDHLAPPNGPT